MDDTNIIKNLEERIEHLEELLTHEREHVETLNQIGKALSGGDNLDTLLGMILKEARHFTNADGGTLYLISPDEKSLAFNVVQTSSLNIYMGGENGKITWPNLPLYKGDGTKNCENVAAYTPPK